MTEVSRFDRMVIALGRLGYTICRVAPLLAVIGILMVALMVRA